MKTGAFGRAFSYVLLGNVVSALIGAVSNVIAMRALVPSEWAVTAIIVGMGASLGLVLSLGSVTYTIRDLSREPSRELRKTKYAQFVVRRVVVGLIVVATACVVGLLTTQTTLAWILLLGGARFIRGGSSLLMSAEKRFASVAFLVVLEKVVALLSLVALSWVLPASPYLFPSAFLISYGAYFLMSLVIERPRIRGKKLLHSILTPMDIWRGSATFGITSLTGPIQQSDVLVMSWAAGDFQAGLLGSGSRLTSGLNVAGAALSNVIMPYFSSPGSSLPIAKILRRWLPLGLFVAILVSATVMTTPVWVPILLGESYVEASGVVAVYLLLSLVMTVNVPAMAILQAWDRERLAMGLALLQSIGGIVGVAVAGFFWGAVGAAMAQLVAALITCALLISGVTSTNMARREGTVHMEKSRGCE